jgi:hypothetical protein
LPITTDVNRRLRPAEETSDTDAGAARMENTEVTTCLSARGLETEGNAEYSRLSHS